MTSQVDNRFKEDLSWEEKAQRNPLFAVMATEQFAAKGGDPAAWTDDDLHAFFAKGEYLYEIFLRPIMRRIPLDPRRSIIVEYGSGMGRILRAIHRDGFACAGIDISATMLEHSRLFVPEVNELSALDADGRSTFASGSADFVFSYAVIQHIHRLSQVKKAFSEMCRLLKPGGVLKVQIRTLDLPFQGVGWRQRIINCEQKSYQITVARRWPGRRLLRWLPPLPRMTAISHTNWVGVPITFANIKAILRANGVRIMGIEEDGGIS